MYNALAHNPLGKLWYYLILDIDYSTYEMTIYALSGAGIIKTSIDELRYHVVSNADE